MPYHTVYASLLLEFVEPASVDLKFTNSSIRPRHFLCEIHMQQPCFFLCQLSPPKHYLPLTVVRWSTPTTTSQHLLLFAISVLLAHLPLSQHKLRWFLFSSLGWNWLLMRTFRRSYEISHTYVTFVLCYDFIVFLAFFIKGLALGTFFGPMVAYLAVVVNKQAQKTMDFYEMFPMNVQDDAHSMRNKGRLSHECLGCYVCVLNSGKWVADSRWQGDVFGTDHFQLYENWDKISMIKVVKNRIVQNLGHTKTKAWQ